MGEIDLDSFLTGPLLTTHKRRVNKRLKVQGKLHSIVETVF